MKIAIIHYRLGMTDGVSLEIDKRAKILKEKGHKLHFICGECSSEFREKNQEDLSIISELHLVKGKAIFMLATTVHARHMDLPEAALVYWFAEQKYKLYKKFDEIFRKHKFDRIVVHNMFSNPIILPAAEALLNVLDKYSTPTLLVNHDFYFERGGFLRSPYKYVVEKIKRMPPKREYITHHVISSVAQTSLLKRTGIRSKVIGDTWDFDLVPQKKDEFNNDFRKSLRIKEGDIIVLQATRITANKGIENAIQFCSQLEKELIKKSPIEVFGRRFSENSRIVLLFSNSTDLNIPKSKTYLERLLKLSKELNVKVVKGFGKIGSNRRSGKGIKMYSFWDAYVHADLITYPSFQEGFGNQLLEAFFYKKLPVLFEYPVFESDIKPGRYSYASLGNVASTKNFLHLVSKKKVEKAVDKIIRIITKPNLLKEATDKNFVIANKRHGIHVLEENLSAWLKDPS